jgi:transcriptional regulator with XRE-family HTH domain
MAFGEKLKYWRAERALTFRGLSDRAHVDIAYLHRLENNLAVQPGRNIILRIAIGLKLDIDDTNDLLIVAGHLPLLRRESINTAHEVHA